MSNRVLAVENHALKSYIGNYDDYKRELEKLISHQEKMVQVENKARETG